VIRAVPLLLTDGPLSPAALAPWIPRGIPHGHLPVGSASFLSRTRARSCCHVKDLRVIVPARWAACEEKDRRLRRICQAAWGSLAGDAGRRRSRLRWRGWCVALPNEGDARPVGVTAAAAARGTRHRRDAGENCAAACRDGSGHAPRRACRSTRACRFA
jgi:hypothetical protein